MIAENRKLRYRVPIAIKDASDNCENLDALLQEKELQASLYADGITEIRGKGYIVLDFGEEMCGGIRIVTHLEGPVSSLYRFRVRFGESLSETRAEIENGTATNDHAARDFIGYMPALGDQIFGDTGFRFVRIDFLDDAVFPIKSIVAREWYRELPLMESFVSNDALVQKIYDVSKRTIDLCLQSKLWDGIKRDRLVWMGDMEPEVHALLRLYGPIDEIEEALTYTEVTNPLPSYANGIPSYSLWYLLVMAEFALKKGDRDVFARHEAYYQGVLKLLSQAIGEDGTVDYTRVNSCPSSFYFIDWPSSDANEEEAKQAHICLYRYALPQIIEALEKYGTDASVAKSMLERLNNAKLIMPRRKQFLAFYSLVTEDPNSFAPLIEGGAKGMSTFMSYFILKAVAQFDKAKAVEMMKEYYGAMLSRGATSFWEDFDIAWLEGSSRIDKYPLPGQKDIHGDYGAYCYKGFRHSLCHGWSCGPVSFCLEELK